MSTPKMGALELKLRAFRKGVETTLPPHRTIVVGGVTFTQTTLLRAVDSELELYDRAHRAHEKLEEAVAARKQRVRPLRRFLANGRAAVVAQFGRQSAELTEFGLNPARETVSLTPEQRQARADKARSTRAKKNGAPPK